MNRALLWVALALLLGGCALNVRTTGFLDPAAGTSAPPAGASFAVLENAEVPNPIFDREIRGKIEILLTKHGYKIAAQDRADYLLTFSYDMSAGLRIGTMTSYGPPRTQIVAVSDGRGGRTFRAITVPGAVTTRPTVTETFTRRLTLKVVDASPLRAGGPERVVWIGDTLSTETSSDLRYDIDYLLAAAFAWFGRDTGRQITVPIHGDNPDVGALRGEK
ncbi:MAG: hypothetical protein WCX34_06315 [Syntrophales bacterium]